MVFKNLFQRAVYKCDFCSRSHTGGFSLIEVSIALIIIGLLLGPTIQLYNHHIEQQKTTTSKAAPILADDALYKYFIKFGHYPKPANPSIAMGDPGFGQADTAVSGWPVCTPTSTVVCQTSTTFGSGVILIGDFPFASLGLPYKSALDGYGRKMSYAVTLSLTDAVTFSEDAGAIDVLRSDGVSIYPLATENHSHYFVTVHGEDGRGAFGLAGTKVSPCGTPATGVDSENCDNDGVFSNNLAPVTLQIAQNFAPGVQHFDDYTATKDVVSGGLWSYIPGTSNQMRKTDEGNVYVGTCLTSPCIPESRMEVNGTVKAQTVLTQRLCGETQKNCVNMHPTSTYIPKLYPASAPWFSPEALTSGPTFTEAALVVSTGNTFNSATAGYTGAGIKCFNHRALGGIKDFDEVCSDTATSGATQSAYFAPNGSGGPSIVGSCVSGEYVSGINVTGSAIHLICSPP